ncbi:hypothetical protein ISN45_Aa06g028710 [Arabidopsis thaliana x Arabidopsis arenosa]|uniref:DUF4283 domain-containing protein n=1 Tax=Arabidopsis thaliana x Arabidopsis arenosa TaxID=1240361 RepID=A0A8T1Z1Y1_9BRAS|nr:hypothetical protein ISN45_Aa06g028710 [Arabidopsis thaliana x Arabidopsis arenosa]
MYHMGLPRRVIPVTSSADQKSSIFGIALGNSFFFRNSSTNLLTETGANSGSSSFSSLRRLRGGQAALHRNVLRELSHELSSFWMNALSLEVTVFIGKEGWRMADTWRTSGDTWRSIPNPCHIAPPVWASINDIPFDLITPEGLSIICRPLGRAVDHKPLTSIISAQVNVIVDLTKPLPNVLELEREDGQVLLLKVNYPWLPPLCSLCNEIGYKAALCPMTPESEMQSLMAGKEKQTSKGPSYKHSSTIHVEKKQVWKPVHGGHVSGDKGVPVDISTSLVPINEGIPTSSQEFQIVSSVNNDPLEVDAPASGQCQIVIHGSESAHFLAPNSSPTSEVFASNFDQSFNRVTHTKLSSPPAITSNPFDILSVEESALVLVIESSSLVQYGSSSTSSSSSNGKKSKRKRFDQIPPAQGGVLSLQGGKRHIQ